MSGVPQLNNLATNNVPDPEIQPSSIKKREKAIYFFLGPNRGAPISLPLNLMPKTLSIDANTFWSGTAVPRSKSATIVGVVLHLVARSFCVSLGSISCLRFEMALPTTFPTVFGLTISSDRSTLVRCCPSTPDLVAFCKCQSRGLGGGRM